MTKQYNSGRNIFLLLVTILLSACGSSSSTPTTIPSTETIFYAHNLVSGSSSLLSTGYNGFGQLGSGDLADRTFLGIVSGYPQFDDQKEIALGGDHSVAFNNQSTARSWGANYYGQLGNGTTTYSTVPVKVAGLSHVKAVAAGAYHTLALLGDDSLGAATVNTLWSWGRNNYGQLGTTLASTYTYSVWPVQVGAGKFANVSSLTVGRIKTVEFTNISSIAANGYHSLARANGFVWGWGNNGAGQLGFDPNYGYTYDPVVVAIPTSTGIIAIAAGGGFSYALDKNSTVWAWGYNGLGQLGNNTKVDSYVPQKVLKADGTELKNIVQIAAGIQHGLALDKNGNVWAWGYNSFGQLGINSKLDSLTAQPVIADVFGTPFSGAKFIRAFGSSSMAKKADGSWYVWGDNAYGQLGIGTKDTQYIPTKMLGF